MTIPPNISKSAREKLAEEYFNQWRNPVRIAPRLPGVMAIDKHFLAGYDARDAEIAILVEALEEIHTKLTPKIPKMDGRESWTIQQKFIDKVVTNALAQYRKETSNE